MDSAFTQVRLNHPTVLPVLAKVENYRRHPAEGPVITLLSGGTGARSLSATLVDYTHNSAHILPMFDDGGSSRELRERFRMPPPGDLRNRLMTLSDMSRRGNPEVSRLFQSRLSRRESSAKLEAELAAFLSEAHPQMAQIESRYRRIILKYLETFAQCRPPGFDLRGGNIGNFVIAGAYLTLGDLEAVVFQFGALAAVRGTVLPVCTGADYHLRADFEDGSHLVGQSRITGQDHPPIRRLSIVAKRDDCWVETMPVLNEFAAKAIHQSALICYTMGSFYTSLVANLLVGGMGRTIRLCKRPKVLVANLRRDKETQGMRVSHMVSEICRSLRSSDDAPGRVSDYLHYVLVNDHGDSDRNDRVPVDLEAIRDLGVEPIVLPIEAGSGLHNSGRVASVLLSLC